MAVHDWPATRGRSTAVGTTADVLVDQASRRNVGELSGRTSGNTVVNFPAPNGGDVQGWIGRMARVRITGAGPHSLKGQIDAGDA